MESLNFILSAPEWERRYKMFNYALNLIQRDISHIYNQAEMRSSFSADLDKLLSELSDVISTYKK